MRVTLQVHLLFYYHPSASPACGRPPFTIVALHAAGVMICVWAKETQRQDGIRPGQSKTKTADSGRRVIVSDLPAYLVVAVLAGGGSLQDHD